MQSGLQHEIAIAMRALRGAVGLGGGGVAGWNDPGSLLLTARTAMAVLVVPAMRHE